MSFADRFARRPAAPPMLFGAVLVFIACSPASPAAQAPNPSDTASPDLSARSTASSASSLTAASAPAAADPSSTPAPTGTLAPAASSTAPALPPVTLVIVEPTKSTGKPPVLSITAPARNTVIPTAKAPTFEARVTAKAWTPAPGDHVCVVLDRGSCKPVPDITQPIRLADLGALDEGQHVLSVLARRKTGEFYRSEGKSVPFASASFFVGKRVPPTHKDGSPMLFYTPPERGPAPTDGVLIDFFVANATVKHGDFIVTASVGGPGIEHGIGLAVEENKPLRLQHARPGEYVSRMTLLQYIPDLGASKATVTVTYTAKPLPGLFGEITRSFFVTR